MKKPLITKALLKDKRFYFSIKNFKEKFNEKFKDKKSVGIDGIKAEDFHLNLDEVSKNVSKKILSGRYRFSPLLEVLKPKVRNKSPRVLGVPTIRDQITLSCLKDYLHANFDECVNRKLPDSYIYEINKEVEKS